MKKIKLFFLCIFSIMLYGKGFAQIFGGNPPAIKWKQINTPLSRVIFPAGLDSTAQRVINIISFMNKPMQATIGSSQKKINLVLQNQTTISNAYVGLAPFRSEFYITPDQNSFDIGSLPWPDQLAIHEFRHVQQYNNFNVGLSKVMYVIFGENGEALANNAAIPNWFFEGDAVYNETNVSLQGRGRLPFFYDGYVSLWKEDKKYSWLKLRNGSYKDFVPDHYKLGFMLVAYGREKYGDAFWKQVTRDAAAFKGIFYPFQKAIKKYAGVNYSEFRRAALDFFKQQFDVANVREASPKKTPVYENDEYPAYAGNDTIIYIKSGYRQVPEFVIATKTNEKKLRIKDFSIDNHFSYNNGKIVYAAYHPDVRWGYRDYSDLRMIDVTKNTEHLLTNHTKYFSPSLNEESNKLVAVSEYTNEKYALHVLDAATGKVLQAIPNTGNYLYTYPKFYNDSTIVSAVRNIVGKMSLCTINIKSGEVKNLLPFSFHVIAFPFLEHDTLYFSYAYKKKDELFAYTFSDKKLWKLIYNDSAGTGRYQLSANAETLAWSTFTAEGYKLVIAKKDAVQFEKADTNALNINDEIFGINVLQKTNFDLLAKVPDSSFAVKKYSKAGKIFNFHSIQPQVSDPDYSLLLLGENILNTFQSQVLFDYNRAEKFKEIGFSATYGQWFPYLSAGINYSFDRRGLYHNSIAGFNELEPFAGFEIPLNFSNKRSFTYLNFGSQYIYNQSNFKGVYKDSLGKISYSYIHNFISFSHQSQSTVQQIFPRFAQTLRVDYKSALTHYSGIQYVVNANLYLPSFFTNHSIVLNGAYLHRDTTTQIDFSSNFPFSRGYSAINLFKMYKWGIDYHLPLLYPDAGFADIVYLLRIRGNVFYDNTYAKDFYTGGNAFSASFRSAGITVNFDTKWWNEANVSIGIRYSRLIDKDIFGGTGSNRWEIILPVNILNQ